MTRRIIEDIIMAKRILTGVIGGAAVISLLFCLYTGFPVFALAWTFGACTGVYEIERASGIKNKFIICISIVAAAFVVMFSNYAATHRELLSPLKNCFFAGAAVLVISMLIIMVFCYKTIKFEQIITAIFATAFIPMGFASILFIRDAYITFAPNYTKSDCVFFILFAIFSSWFTDIGAYFVGSFLGKHKLCPEISPKKTVEGALGGIVVLIFLNFLLLLVFRQFFNCKIEYYIILPASAFLAVISMFGDLAASVMKRNHGIKDYGNLLPGMGGIMDRFDSSMFVFPCVYGGLLVANNFFGA